MTGSRRVPAGTLTTSTNATNGSGNLFVDFKDLVQPVAIYFVALLSSIVASTGLLVNAGCCVFTTVVLARELGLEPRITESKSVVLPLHYSRTTWRKTEESNPIRFLGTWFSRPVGAPTHLHYLPTWYPG